MGHRNARSTVHGRRLLVERVQAGMPVAHVAQAMGVSRQCAHRSVTRFAAEGEQAFTIEAHDHTRRRLAPARRSSSECWRHAGSVAEGRTGSARSSVSKYGRGNVARDRTNGPGYDYVHSVVDDHCRLADSEILDNEKADTTTAFFARAIDFFTAHGITIERLMTDNAWNYRHSSGLKGLLARHGVRHKFIRPHCPWQSSKVERFNRTLATEWAYRQVFDSNAERTAALAPRLDHYNTE